MGEFNSTKMNDDTSIKNFRIILKKGGFSKKFRDELTFVFWDIRNTFYNKNATKFESYNSEKYKVFYFSGYDGSVISFLTGCPEEKEKARPKNAQELVKEAFNQELIQQIEV